MREQVKEYKRNGVTTINEFINKKTSTDIKKKINKIFCNQLKKLKIIKKNVDVINNPKLFSLYQKKNINSYNNTCLKIIQKIPEIYNFGTSKKILKLVKSFGLKEPIFSTDPLIMINSKYSNNKHGWQYAPLHQDWRSIQGSLNCLVIWIPLTSLDNLTGGIEYIKSSHLSGLQKTKDHSWYKAAKYYNEKTQLTKCRPKNNEAILFSSFLLHKSEINRSNKVRISLQYRYNDLSEETFIKRDYPCNYKHAEPKKKLITKNFPNKLNLEKIFS